MSKIKTALKLIINSNLRFVWLANKGLKGKTPADKFLKKEYRFFMGRELNLEDPQLYTEKLQWLKLYDHRPEYTTMVDKYTVKHQEAELHTPVLSFQYIQYFSILQLISILPHRWATYDISLKSDAILSATTQTKR